MSQAKKKQDEKNTKILRELVSLPGNKHCFDCNQRGPTYVNMTIGSFICTGCSGILRGLNPPHRVKSISMASFTPEEMEFLKSRGNDHCRRVWLGLHDRQAGMPPEPDARSNEQSVRDFMAIKYEKKRYYVSPSEELFVEARAINQPVFDRIEKGQGAKGARSILGINAPPSATAAKLAGPPAPVSASATSTARPTAPASAAAVAASLPVSAAPAPQPQPPATASNTADLLGADLFSSGGGSNGVAVSSSDSGFANFDLLSSGGSGVSHSTDFFGGGLQQPSASTATLQPRGASVNAAAAPLTQPQPAFGGSGPATADKYAAFADLFNSAPSDSTNIEVANSSGPSAFSTGVSAQPAAAPMPSGPIDWSGGAGFGGGAGSGGGINWGGVGGVGNNGGFHPAATSSAPTSTAPWAGAAQPSWDAMGGGSIGGVSSSQSWNANWGGGGGGGGGGGMSWASAAPVSTTASSTGFGGGGGGGASNPFNPFGGGGMQPQQQPQIANPFFGVGGGVGGPPSYYQQQQPPQPSAGTNPFL